MLYKSDIQYGKSFGSNTPLTITLNFKQNTLKFYHYDTSAALDYSVAAHSSKSKQRTGTDPTNGMEQLEPLPL